MKPWVVVGVVTFALLGAGCGTSETGDTAPSAVVPADLTGTWRFAEIVSPLPAGVPVPPPVQQSLDRTKAHLRGLVLTLTPEVARAEKPGQSTVEGPITFSPASAGAGTLNLPAPIMAALGPDRVQRSLSVTWTATTLHLPRPEGTVVLHRQP